MPEELQEAMLRTVPGIEEVKMVRPAYGEEYDFVDPRELARAYSCRFIPSFIDVVFLQRRLRQSASRYYLSVQTKRGLSANSFFRGSSWRGRETAQLGMRKQAPKLLS